MNHAQDDGLTRSDTELMRMTAEIVASYVSHNAVEAERLPELINAVHNSLKSVDNPVDLPEEQPSKPAVPVRKSVHADYIICLAGCGKSLPDGGI